MRLIKDAGLRVGAIWRKPLIRKAIYGAGRAACPAAASERDRLAPGGRIADGCL